LRANATMMARLEQLRTTPGGALPPREELLPSLLTAQPMRSNWSWIA
jgi:hypothetical protein